MSDAPALNGQVIGQTERATRAVLDVLLAETATPFPQWVVLNVLADAGELSSDALVERLMTGLRIQEDDALDAVSGARAASLVGGGDPVGLSHAGRARYEVISAGIADISRRLYGGLPHEDLVTTRRVLETLTERARAELAGR
jgi:hypothetical protein